MIGTERILLPLLRKQGTPLTALSRSIGLSSSTLANVLVRPWPKGEWLVAEALDIHPAEIWPSRYYDKEGKLIDRKIRMR